MERNPDLPKNWLCGACDYSFEIPRSWVKTKNMGWQIIVNWPASEFLIENHMSEHTTQLISEIEDWLNAGT